jgi:hypothetical protein
MRAERVESRAQHCLPGTPRDESSRVARGVLFTLRVREERVSQDGTEERPFGRQEATRPLHNVFFRWLCLLDRREDFIDQSSVPRLLAGNLFGRCDPFDGSLQAKSPGEPLSTPTAWSR